MRDLILIVDDDVRNIFALRLTLKAKGFDVLTSQSGQDALNLLSQNSDIKLILMDMMMPEMDGYEAIKILKSSDKYPTIPIISVTAQAMSGDMEKCLEVGADDYVSKPIEVDRLISIIKRWI